MRMDDDSSRWNDSYYEAIGWWRCSALIAIVEIARCMQMMRNPRDACAVIVMGSHDAPMAVTPLR